MDRKGWAALPSHLGDAEVRQLTKNIASPVALTGATGFVGSHVLEALRRAGVPRRVLVRGGGRLAAVGAEEEVILGALDEPAALRPLLRGVGTVLHIAGLVRAARQEDFERANAAGTAALLEAAAQVTPAARVVYVSSLAAAGPSPTPAGLPAERPPAPVSAYGSSKLRGEEHVRRWRGAWVILRPPAIYGPRDRDVLQFFRLVARGVVPVPAGERWVTVAHVADVVRAVLAGATVGTGEVLPLGEPRPWRLDELLAALAEAGGLPRPRIVPLPTTLVRAAGLAGDALQRLGWRGVAMTSDKAQELLARHWTADTAPTFARLGLAGYVPFSDGARATWEWYRQHGWVARATIPAA